MTLKDNNHQRQLLNQTYRLRKSEDIDMTIVNNELLEVETNDLLLDEFDFDAILEDVEVPTPIEEVQEEIAETPQIKPKRKRQSKKAETKEESTPSVSLQEGPKEETQPQPQVQEQVIDVDLLASNGVAKLKGIEAYLNQRFVEREEVVKNIMRTLAVGTNMLLLGEPGTGKSDIIQTTNNLIEGANYFSWLVNRTSDPAELVGPYSLKAMENDEFVRKTTGKLPEAHISFIDEIKFRLLLS